MWRRRRCEALRTSSALAESVTGEPGASSQVTTTAETVPVSTIVGTIARCCDFDGCFQPLHRHLRERLDDLRTAMCCRQLPTIRLVQVGHEHFVIDGHHRVALARERGMVAMDAIVTCRCPSGSV